MCPMCRKHGFGESFFTEEETCRVIIEKEYASLLWVMKINDHLFRRMRFPFNILEAEYLSRHSIMNSEISIAKDIIGSFKLEVREMEFINQKRLRVKHNSEVKLEKQD